MRRSLTKVIVPLALVLALAACGSDDDDGDAAASTTTSTTEAAAETTTTPEVATTTATVASSPYGDLEAMCTSLLEFPDGASPENIVALFDRIAETVPPRLEADAVVVRDVYRSLAEEIAAAADAAEVRALVGPAGVGKERSFAAVTEAIQECTGEITGGTAVGGSAVGEP